MISTLRGSVFYGVLKTEKWRGGVCVWEGGWWEGGMVGGGKGMQMTSLLELSIAVVACEGYKQGSIVCVVRRTNNNSVNSFLCRRSSSVVIIVNHHHHHHHHHHFSEYVAVSCTLSPRKQTLQSVVSCVRKTLTAVSAFFCLL